MRILALDSSGLVATVAILEDEQMIAEYTVNYKKTHSQTLLPMLDEIVKMTEFDLETIDAIAVAGGPGSFTGIRVGLSTIKAFNIVNNKKLVSLNAFEPFLSVVKSGVVLLNSTRTSFYYAIIRSGKILEMDLVSYENLADIVKGKKVYMLDFEKYTELQDCDIKYIDNYSELLRDAVQTKIKRGEYTTDSEFEPVYLQLSQAELQLNKKNG